MKWKFTRTNNSILTIKAVIQIFLFEIQMNFAKILLHRFDNRIMFFFIKFMLWNFIWNLKNILIWSFCFSYKECCQGDQEVLCGKRCFLYLLIYYWSRVSMQGIYENVMLLTWQRLTFLISILHILSIFLLEWNRLLFIFWM